MRAEELFAHKTCLIGNIGNRAKSSFLKYFNNIQLNSIAIENNANYYLQNQPYG